VLGTGRVHRTTSRERVIGIKVPWVVVAIVVGLLIVLLVGVVLHPDDEKQPTGSARLSALPSPTTRA
jgi:hypothetical protein